MRKTAIAGSAAAVLAIATPFIAGWEGLETRPYEDVGGVATVCYGETENVEDRTYTPEECLEMLQARIPDYYAAAMHHVKVEMPITMQVAVTSFVYNVGEGAFRRSTMLRLINEGRLHEACEQLERWSYVGQMWVRGLYRRRKAEYKLCVAELPLRGV